MSDQPAFAATKCAVCGAAVGLLWIRGRSTLVETKVQEFEGAYLIKPHRCPGLQPAAELDPPEPQPAPTSGYRRPGLERHQPPRRRPPHR